MNLMNKMMNFAEDDDELMKIMNLERGEGFV